MGKKRKNRNKPKIQLLPRGVYTMILQDATILETEAGPILSQIFQLEDGQELPPVITKAEY